MLHISLSAEKIAQVGPFPITNSLLATWIVMGFIAIFAYFAGRTVTLIPSNLQSIAEILISGLYEFFESVMGTHVKKTFPILASLFLFIILANWFGLVPGVGSIGFYEQETSVSSHNSEQTASPDSLETSESIETSETPHSTEVTEESTEHTKFVPLLRGATADLNTTIALALVSLFSIQYFGFATLGSHYSKRFFNFSNPILLFVGFLELISDLSKVISFAFRLFGNIFAGEVLLGVIAFLMPFIAPTPFLLLELFVGFIQALVFSTLTAVFINVALAHEG